MKTILQGQRVKIDCNRIRISFPKDRTGQLSIEGVRLSRTFEAIVDSTGFRPFVTEVRDNEVEIASNYFGEEMRTLRVPRAAVLGICRVT